VSRYFTDIKSTSCDVLQCLPVSTVRIVFGMVNIKPLRPFTRRACRVFEGSWNLCTCMIWYFWLLITGTT
ncbi:hypothetical protein GDO78_022623, partial [Eleutherodactylus coqui]